MTKALQHRPDTHILDRVTTHHWAQGDSVVSKRYLLILFRRVDCTQVDTCDDRTTTLRRGRTCHGHTADCTVDAAAIMYY